VEDEQDNFQEIRLGDLLIWRELAFRENGTRFGEIEDLLKQKYGTRFTALPLTLGSRMWLWGDKIRRCEASAPAFRSSNHRE